MPSYIQQIRRIPKPGKSESVLQHSIERLKSLNRRGNVNFTVSASGESEGAIATDIPISSVSDLELFHDAFRSSPDSIKAFDEIAEECAKVELQIYRVVEPGVQPEGGAKYNARNILVAKRGEVENVIETLRELRSTFETVTPLITVPVGGNSDIVRAVAQLASLEQLEQWSNEQTSDKFKEYRARIGSLTIHRFVEVNRVEYRSKG